MNKLTKYHTSVSYQRVWAHPQTYPPRSLYRDCCFSRRLTRLSSTDPPRSFLASAAEGLSAMCAQVQMNCGDM